uniref:Peptidase S1 domain-containing protein n=1 Tax=Trichuris muris TaxID=70415 RepID=A0A5S6QRC6_TRIMR
MLRLKKTILYNEHVLPVCIPESGQELPQDSQCFTAGWGVTENGQLSTTLRVVEVRIQPGKACKRYPYSPFNEKTMICTTARPKKKGTCMGDSGGPMVCLVNKRFVQFGIVSWGQECGDYTVFTSVAHYSSWLKSCMQNQRKASSTGKNTNRQPASTKPQAIHQTNNQQPAMAYVPTWTQPFYMWPYPGFFG